MWFCIIWQWDIGKRSTFFLPFLCFFYMHTSLHALVSHHLMSYHTCMSRENRDFLWMTKNLWKKSVYFDFWVLICSTWLAGKKLQSEHFHLHKQETIFNFTFSFTRIRHHEHTLFIACILFLMNSLKLCLDFYKFFQQDILFKDCNSRGISYLYMNNLL